MEPWRVARIERAKDFVNKIKMATACVRCGKVAVAPEQMSFVAKPGSVASRPVGKLICSGASLERLAQEIANRDIVCPQCAPKRKISRVGALTPVVVSKEPKPKKLSQIEQMFADVEARNRKYGVRMEKGHIYDLLTGAEITYEQAQDRFEGLTAPEEYL